VPLSSDVCGTLPVEEGTPTSVGVCDLPFISSPSEDVSRCGKKKICCPSPAVDGLIHDSKVATNDMKERCTESVEADIPTETDFCCVDQESAGDDDEINYDEACNSGKGSWFCSSSTSTDCCNGMSRSCVSLRRRRIHAILVADNILLQKSVSSRWRRSSVMKLAIQEIGVSVSLRTRNRSLSVVV
jgi:hypothetical protein